MAPQAFGIQPGGAPGAEGAAVIRRSFVPILMVQTRNATPTLAAFWGNSKTATGGMDAINVPMQGGPMVNTQSTSFAGTFNMPQALNPIVDAVWPLKAVVTPIPFYGMEALLEWDAAIIPRLAARMNDVGNSQAAYYADKLQNNATYGSQDIDGLPLIASAAGTYAGLSRASNTWLQANVINAGGVDPTRALLNQYITSASKFNDGEAPDIGFTGPGTWSRLSRDYLGLEQFVRNGDFKGDVTQGSGFRALMVGNIPIYYDPAFGTEGTIRLTKRKYTSMYVHQAATFAFTGFSSTIIAGQLGYIGLVITVAEMVSVKPKAWTAISGLNFDSV